MQLFTRDDKAYLLQHGQTVYTSDQMLLVACGYVTKKQLETGRKGIDEVMLDIGYSDTQTFRDVFKRIKGMTPVGYRNNHNKDSFS